MNPLLGTVTTAASRYELYADGSWRLVNLSGVRRQGDDEFERSLTQLYNGSRWHGPSVGRPGSAILHDLAKSLNGTVNMPPQPPGPPGVVY